MPLYKSPRVEGPPTWSDALLSVTVLKFLIILNRWSGIFILQWTPQIMQLVLPSVLEQALEAASPGA